MVQGFQNFGRCRAGAGSALRACRSPETRSFRHHCNSFQRRCLLGTSGIDNASSSPLQAPGAPSRQNTLGTDMDYVAVPGITVDLTSCKYHTAFQSNLARFRVFQAQADLYDARRGKRISDLRECGVPRLTGKLLMKLKRW